MVQARHLDRALAGRRATVRKEALVDPIGSEFARRRARRPQPRCRRCRTSVRTQGEPSAAQRPLQARCDHARPRTPGSHRARRDTLALSRPSTASLALYDHACRAFGRPAALVSTHTPGWAPRKCATGVRAPAPRVSSCHSDGPPPRSITLAMQLHLCVYPRSAAMERRHRVSPYASQMSVSSRTSMYDPTPGGHVPSVGVGGGRTDRMEVGCGLHPAQVHRIHARSVGQLLLREMLLIP
jgi:hypothetical protein